jgi:rhodanese-related sulfurtransferase
MEPRSESESVVRQHLPETPRVTVDEVKARLDRGEPIVFLDTRAPDAWEKSDVRVKGAIRVPPDEVDRHLHEIPRDRSIVTYCT